MRCPYCGLNVTGYDTFCPRCGKRINIGKTGIIICAIVATMCIVGLIILETTEEQSSYKDLNTPVISQIEQPDNEQTTEQVGTATFDEIYQAYEENELRADEQYQNHYYSITAVINGMTNDGLINLTGGATLTLERQVGDTIVFFYAEFEKDQEEALKTVNVGDTITFEGKCLDAGSWCDCTLIIE